MLQSRQKRIPTLQQQQQFCSYTAAVTTILFCFDYIFQINSPNSKPLGFVEQVFEGQMAFLLPSRQCRTIERNTAIYVYIKLHIIKHNSVYCVF